MPVARRSYYPSTCQPVQSRSTWRIARFAAAQTSSTSRLTRTGTCGYGRKGNRMLPLHPDPHIADVDKIEGYHMDITAEFMAAIINAFQANKRLADRAVEQVP